MSSDSTTTESEDERIKEAVDENFLTEDLYADKIKKKPESLPKPISLRNQNHQEILTNPFSITVTPEFQRHVSKHLSRLLDEIIDDRGIIKKKKKKLTVSHSDHGIKLLYSSKDYLLSSSTLGKAVKSKKFAAKGNSDINYEKRAKEVAVTSEWVLSQEETKYWASNTKGKVEIVKHSNSFRNFNHLKNHLIK